MDEPDVTLYLGLATAIATALGAAFHFDLVKRRHSAWQTAGVILVISAAVLGIVSALIAVGKGRSQTPLTQLMFLGVVAPGLYALSAALTGAVSKRGARYATLATLSVAAGILVLATSPSVVRALFSPRNIEAERTAAEKRTRAPYYPGRSYECKPAATGFSWCDAAGAQAAFNAYRNSSGEGDERRFVKGLVHARLSILRDTRSTTPFDVVEVNKGEEVRVRVYFRNAAVPDPKHKQASVMQNARLGVFVPSDEIAGVSVLAVLYADNAKPRVIADRVAFVADEPIRLSYVPESARLINKYSGQQGSPGSGIQLPDDVVHDADVIDDDPKQFRPELGTPLGYSKLDGRIDGGFPQQGWVWLNFRVE